VTTVPASVAPVGVKIAVSPPSGPVGTVFSFSATGFKPNESVSLEIDFADGKSFKGAVHTAGADGSFKASYTVTPTNGTGTFTVKGVGNQGTTGDGHFDVTGGGSVTTKKGTSTTRPAARTSSTTTTKHATSTTK
jgi:hypothetical protein